MAENQISQKRFRDEKALEDSAGSKRRKPYNNIISLLDDDDEEEEVEPSRDLSAIFTTLQQELSSSESQPSAAAAAEDEMAIRHVTDVMRHLLEASDDELGIPNRSTDEINPDKLSSGDNINLTFTNDYGLWEFEDEAANYYTVLQSQLFM
ncbi:hypothetical protein CASFOL_024124 [Castilleja foliolosa]|uniref:Uncharacterized protein n=1 Tax=Castilleja foliolosa TaxID=1961234 RepID=A0ABD3CME0_9LAMI